MLQLKNLIVKNVGSHLDSIYTFKNNKLNVIVGINKDTTPKKYQALSIEELVQLSDFKLPSNGSGKSMILEALNLVIFSEPIRKSINPRDLIFKGKEFMEITLNCREEWEGLDISITRKVFSSRTKTSTLEVFENGCKIEKPSIEELNKYILAKYIGISKEDLINFFIIQKDRYQPFLLLSDSKKKEMISRFTGIDRFNYIQSEIDTFIANKEKEKSAVDILKAQIQGKIELLQEERDSLPLEDSFKDKIKEETSIWNQEIKDFEKETTSINEDILLTKKESENVKGLILHWNKRKEKFFLLLKKYCVEELLELRSDLKEIEETESILSDKVSALKVSNQTLIELIAKFQVLINGAIECPNCKHKFSPSNKKGLDEIKKDLEKGELDKKSILKKIKGALEEDTEIKECKQNIKEKIITLEKRQNRFSRYEYFIEAMISNYDLKLKNTKNKIVQKETSLETITYNIKKKKEKIVELKKSSFKDILDKKDSIQENIDQYQLALEVKDKDIAKVESQIQIYRDSLVIYGKFKNYLYNKTILNIQQIVNFYLSKFSDLFIKIEGFKFLADGKTQRDEISIEVEKDNKIISYYLLSSGERATIDVSFILAFQQIINGNSLKGLNYICLDEIIGTIDSFNANELLKVLNSLGKTIDIISHVAILGEFPVTYIVKESSNSKIITNE